MAADFDKATPNSRYEVFTTSESTKLRDFPRACGGVVVGISVALGTMSLSGMRVYTVQCCTPASN